MKSIICMHPIPVGEVGLSESLLCVLALNNLKNVLLNYYQKHVAGLIKS